MNLDQAAIRAELEAEFAELTQREERIGAHQHNTDREVPRDSQERATFRENDQVVDRLDEHTRRDLATIKATLARMDAGHWGKCASCGGKIAAKRLLALPTALRCLRCAAEHAA